MKSVTIKRITIENWRGQTRTIALSDKNEIRGRNRSGKSTILNAHLWLVLGIDEEDRVNYQLFDNTIVQTHETSKIASVEELLDIDGIEYTLKRTAEMGWTRKRGHEEYERKGTDVYKFYIDEIERNATEYKKFIDETFAPFDKMKFMLNTQYFLKVDWKAMRKQLESMVGEIKSSDFKGDYGIISSDLSKYTTDEIKVRYKALMKPIKENVSTLPTTIEALTSNLPNLEGVDEVEANIKEAKEQIAELDKQILGDREALNAKIAEQDKVMKEISELKKSYNERLGEYNSTFEKKCYDIKYEIESIKRDNTNIERINKENKEAFETIKYALKREKEIMASLEDYRKVLLAQNEEVKAMRFNDDKCPYCGQLLPEDRLEKEKKQFLERKEAKHKAIVEEGKANNIKIEDCKKKIERFEANITNGFKETKTKSTKELEAELADLRKSFIKFDKTTEGEDILSKIEEKQGLLKDNKPNNNEGLIRMRNSLMNEIQEESKKLGLRDEYERQVDKIKSLQKQLKDNASELALLEGKMDALNEYEREKASIISVRVNGMFDYVRIEMTTMDKGGNIVDTCKILDNKGVDAQVTNNASKVLCGIDISKAFQKHYGLNLPIILDNAESINDCNIPKMDNQLIKLVVDDCDLVTKSISLPNIF